MWKKTYGVNFVSKAGKGKRKRLVMAVLMFSVPRSSPNRN
jgi:hypothetical protein